MKTEQKQIETEINDWEMKYFPKITEIDLNEMYKEHLKNHPNLQIKE